MSKDAKASKAAEFMAQGDKKMKAWSWFSSNKYDEAATFYNKAGNMFKMANKWIEGGEAYCKSAEAYQTGGTRYKAAQAFISASACYKKASVGDAINCLQMAIDILTDEGRFSIAAKQQKEIAILQEEELDYAACIDSYRLAAELYEGENATGESNQCLLKVALYCAQLEKYNDAIEIYEQVASNAIGNNLLKWNAKEYFFRAALCHLCTGDVVSTRRALEKYVETFLSFSREREYRLLEQILDAYENFDVEAFTNAVVEFDSISKLDQWKTSVLLRIKNSIKDEELDVLT